jgi:secreted trypsin-like serine protease
MAEDSSARRHRRRAGARGDAISGRLCHRGSGMRRLGTSLRAVVFAAVLSVVMVDGGSASAIVNGHADGDGHPYVGVLVADYITPGYMQRFCSGSLVAPTIVLTSAHCMEGIALNQVSVSFEPVYIPGRSVLYHGTAVVYPGYGSGAASGKAEIHDIAVVHLDRAPPITPVRLASRGLLSSLDLSGQTFPAVGYGRTRVDKTGGPNNIEPNFDPDVRNATENQPFLGLTATFLHTSSNAAKGTGDEGGTCFGDSGGPVLLGTTGVLVALIATGDSVCRASSFNYRIDTDSAREFLRSQGVPLS